MTRDLVEYSQVASILNHIKSGDTFSVVVGNFAVMLEP